MAAGKPDLPIHFRTGLRAVGIVNGRPVWPVLGGDESDDAAAQAAAKATADAAAAKAAADAAKAGDEKGFPANTPLEQMKPEQREAYWKHQSRKHEDRAKVFGSMTAEQLKDLQDKAAKHDEMELELGTTAEKAAAKAAKEAKEAARAETDPVVISAKLDAAAARAGVTEADLAKAVEFIDTKKFLKSDGTVDTDKVKSFIDTITPAKGNGNNRLGPSSGGTGSHQQAAPGSAAEKGREEAKRRGFIKSA